jgi:small-conductance mechanosensitive channel
VRSKLKCFIVLSSMLATHALAASSKDETAHQISELERDVVLVTAPIEIDGRTLFRVRGVSSLPAEQRAAGIRARIIALARNPAFKTDSLRVAQSDGFVSIMGGDERVMAIADADAELEQVSLDDLARAGVDRIRGAIAEYRAERTTSALLRSGAYLLATVVVLVLGLFVFNWLALRLEVRVLARLEGRIRTLGIQSFEIVRADRVLSVIAGLQRTLRFVCEGAFAIACVSYALRLFPFTRATGNHLFELVTVPLVATGRGVLEAIPGVLFLVLLFVIVRFCLKLIRLFFDAVGQGSVQLRDFEAEWADPTYKVVRLIIVVLALVVAYPYIPGSDSAAFKGVSVLIGVLLSLGSSSAIANIIAGYSMIYRRAFKLGDRVQVGDTIGDVIQMRLQGTHVRTLKNEEVVIPSSQILNSHVVNFSSLGAKQGLILHTTVGIGYEVPWRQVHAMLLMAADRTDNVEKEPPPFVNQTSLGDFGVNYEVNVFTRHVHHMNAIYTRLHQNILDVFNEYGVAIMTPAYVADPADAKIVPKDRWHALPASPEP